MSGIRTVVLTSVAFGVNAAIDSGDYAHITLDDVRGKIEDGTIFAFLEHDVNVDVSLVVPEKRAELLEHWRSLKHNADSAGELGVNNNGLCLILAYILEGIQNGTSL